MAQNVRPGGPSWPSVDERQAKPLFRGRQPFRKLVVLLDSAVLDPVDESAWSKEWLLAGLLTLEIVECLRYADEGPPADAEQHSDDIVGEWVIGWAVLGPEEQGAPMGHRSVRWATDDKSVTDSALIGDISHAAAADNRTNAYSGLDPAVAAEQRRSDALSAQVAETIGADMFITGRQYLYEATWTVADGVTYCDINDALRIIGLYLRSQGSFITSRDPAGRGTHTMNRGLYYWVGTRELLPSAWRWFAACVQHSRAVENDSLLLLGQSVLQRIQRALQVRDEVHIALNKPQDNDTADDALSSLDVALLLLMGAVDATARVAHAVLGISGSAYSAGWHHEKNWVANVSASAPELGALFQGATDHVHALTILRLLRNSIHGEALPALGVGVGRRRDGTLVGLPGLDQAELLGAFAALGGDAAWGVEQRLPGRLHADPGTLLEQLLPRVLRMLNEIMDATPVEQLPNVSLQPSDLEVPVTPAGSYSDPFDEISRQSIRWQLGL